LAAFNLGVFTRPLIVAAARPDTLELLRGSTHIPETGGARAPAVFVAFDPYCRHCRALHEVLAKHIAAGEIRVEWVPVAFMDPNSLSVGAQILSAAKPSLALTRWFGAEAGNPGEFSSAASPEENQSRIVANTQLVRSLVGRDVAPALFYHDRSGATQLTVGAPSDIEHWLHSLSR
jgi:hypothetical protein